MLTGVHAQETVDQLGHPLHGLLHQPRHALRLRHDLARLLGHARLRAPDARRDEDGDIGAQEPGQPHQVLADGVQVRRRGLGPEPLAQLGDVAQPAADSLELLVDVDCLASPAEHGRQVRLALLLEPLHHHEPLHGALDEVLGAADLTGGLLVLVVVLRHLLAQ